MAVLFVVIFHFFPGVLPNGFIGVDIFFVLSGYLIGEILLREIHLGKFSFLDFYKRRAIRILPALMTVLAFTYLIGYGSLISEKFLSLAEQIRSASLFVINFLWIKEAGYFGAASEAKILLHLWSLSIEEQFYILFPFILWGAYRLRLNILAVASALFVGSFLLAARESDFSVHYFSFHTRIWEILAGSLYAGFARGFFKLDFNFDASSQMFRKNIEVVPFFCFVLLLATATMLALTNSYTAFNALVPVLCTIVLLSTEESWFNRNVLSRPILVGIGLISYPLYLWHWPLISFHYIIRRNFRYDSENLILLAISLGFAVLTYLYIEKPIRNSPNKVWNSLKLVAGLVFVISVSSYTAFRKGLPQRYDSELDTYSSRVWNYDGEDVSQCHNLLKDISDPICATTPNPKVALFGDSHAAHYFQGFRLQDHPRFKEVLAIGAGNCSPFGYDTPRCKDALRIGLNYIIKSKTIETVVIGGVYYSFSKVGDATALRILNETINSLKAAEKKVVFVVDSPMLFESAERCYSPDLLVLKYLRETPQFCSGSLPQHRFDQSKYLNFVSSLKALRPDILYYDPNEFLCEREKCKVFHDGVLLYSDNNHLSKNGAKLLVEDMISKIEL